MLLTLRAIIGSLKNSADGSRSVRDTVAGLLADEKLRKINDERKERGE